MIHPSYVDLMKVVNSNTEEGEEPVISSRYSIVMATARRARQIVAGDDPLIRTKINQKPLSIAVEELNQNEIRILTDRDRDKNGAAVSGIVEDDMDVDSGEETVIADADTDADIEEADEIDEGVDEEYDDDAGDDMPDEA